MSKKKSGGPKTAAIRALEQKGIPFTLRPQAHGSLTAEGVARELGLPVAKVVKAMIVKNSSNAYHLFVIPGDRQLSLKKVAGVLNDKRVELAQGADVERITGYRVGAVSVLGYRRQGVPVCLDTGIFAMEEVLISGGRPDLGLTVATADLVRALDDPRREDVCQG